MFLNSLSIQNRIDINIFLRRIISKPMIEPFYHLILGKLLICYGAN